jgi:hypothetical protein
MTQVPTKVSILAAYILIYPMLGWGFLLTAAMPLTIPEAAPSAAMSLPLLLWWLTPGGCLGILTNLQAAKLRNVLGLNIGKHPNEFNGLRWLKMILFKEGCQKVNIKHDLLF